MWERAGLSVPAILAAVDAGTLSLDFLDSPAWALPEPLPITYRELAEEHGIPAASPSGHPGGDGVRGAGSRRPGPAGRHRPGGARPYRARSWGLGRERSASLPPVRRQRPAPRVGRGRPVHGGTREAVGRLRGGRVGADAPGRRGRPSDGRPGRANDPGALRAPAATHLDRVRRQEGRDGARTSRAPGAGRVDAGDLLRGHDGVHTAHRRARGRRGGSAGNSLSALVNEVSRTHGGRAIRWLGDGGLFYFEDASAAFAAALEMSERAPSA